MKAPALEGIDAREVRIGDTAAVKERKLLDSMLSEKEGVCGAGRKEEQSARFQM